MIFEQLNIHIHRNYLDTDQISFMKNNSKLIMDLKVKCKTIKLDDNIRESIHGFGYDCRGPAPAGSRGTLRMNGVGERRQRDTHTQTLHRRHSFFF